MRGTWMARGISLANADLNGVGQHGAQKNLPWSHYFLICLSLFPLFHLVSLTYAFFVLHSVFEYWSYVAIFCYAVLARLRMYLHVAFVRYL